MDRLTTDAAGNRASEEIQHGNFNSKIILGVVLAFHAQGYGTVTHWTGCDGLEVYELLRGENG